MKTYTVKITEISEREVNVTASSPEEAAAKVRDEYRRGVHELDWQDFTETSVCCEDIEISSKDANW